MPLLQYSIDTALAIDEIEKVFVSTDDVDIANCAKQCGAIVIDRPAELATDQSPEWLSWRHAIDWATAQYGSFDGFVSLPATSPLRSVEDVQMRYMPDNNNKLISVLQLLPQAVVHILIWLNIMSRDLWNW